jgi:hypothetical protein
VHNQKLYKIKGSKKCKKKFQRKASSPTEELPALQNIKYVINFWGFGLTGSGSESTVQVESCPPILGASDLYLVFRI